MRWRGFIGAFGVSGAAIALACFVFALILDPYGLRAGPGRAPGPIMDLNQRFMYPQVIRSGRYDAAVFGTSTVRLLDPEALDETFGGRFANLAMNAATPWEQTQIAELFLRTVPRPHAVVLGLDTTWCDADADTPAKRTTFRPFPPWLYDEDALNDLPHLVSFQAVGIAARVLLDRLGLMPERIRGDGFQVFVPPEDRYNLARARWRIWHGGEPAVRPVEPLIELTPAERKALRMPALAWLEDLMHRLPPETIRVLLFPPVHVAAQTRPGSLEAERVAECKARVAATGARHGATVVDFQVPSPVTTDDANYWDGLHYRLPVAGRIIAFLKQATGTKMDDPGGIFRVLGAR